MCHICEHGIRLIKEKYDAWPKTVEAEKKTWLIRMSVV